SSRNVDGGQSAGWAFRIEVEFVGLPGWRLYPVGDDGRSETVGAAAVDLERVGPGVRVAGKPKLVVTVEVIARLAPRPVRVTHQAGFKTAVVQDVLHLAHGEICHQVQTHQDCRHTTHVGSLDAFARYRL